MMGKLKCYIYTRVSTAMQVDGYSLAAQKEKLKGYADLHDIEILGEYSDEGKSGKNIEGRPEFQRMLMDIEREKDGIDLVVVFKLSRFGRSCADTLNTLEMMKEHDVDLVCIEDGIDSRNEMSRIIIAIMSAIAEMERENISIQTMAGRRQKAMTGGWNGGFAPTGYTLQDGELVVNEAEAEVVRIIFDRYVNYDMSISGVARFLRENGYRRAERPNAKTDYYSERTVKDILDAEIYMGKITYGKTTTKRKKGTKAFQRVETDEYIVADGKHEAIISDELWKQAHEKRKKGKRERNYYRISKDSHRYILSGLVKCPVCGKGMAGMNSRGKIKKDDTRYPDIHYYRCRHYKGSEGYKCNYKHQLNCAKVDGAVEEIVMAIVNQDKFSEMIIQKINTKVDTGTFDKTIERLKKELASLEKREKALYKSIEMLDADDKHFERKRNGINQQMDDVLEAIDKCGESLEKTEEQKERMKKSQISAENIYTILANFGKMYYRLDDNEKFELMHALIKEIEVYEEKRADKRMIQSITFTVPVIYGGREIQKISLPTEPTDETVALLTQYLV